MSETSETGTWRDAFADIPWVRLVVVATLCAVTATFAQILFTGDANPAVTAGVTGAITAVAGMGGRREPGEHGRPAERG